MGYHLVVFEETAVPNNYKDFLEWFKKQLEGNEGHGYDDPSISSKSLQGWFREIIKTYPQAKGPYALSDDKLAQLKEKYEDDSITDYFIGKNIILGDFTHSSFGKGVHEVVEKLAKKFEVGFFEPYEDKVILHTGEIIKLLFLK